MTDTDDAERRQAARRALLGPTPTPERRYVEELATQARQGVTGDLPKPPPGPVHTPEPTDEDRLIADGFVFSVAARRREEADAEHRARRRRADAEVASRQRYAQTMRDSIHAPWDDGGDDAA